MQAIIVPAVVAVHPATLEALTATFRQAADTAWTITGSCWLTLEGLYGTASGERDTCAAQKRPSIERIPGN
jgi:hypothetical protein